MMAAPHSDKNVTLADLFGDMVPAAIAHRTVPDIFSDSRFSTDGGLFLARQGHDSHGLDYLGEALRRGAAFAAWEPAPGAEVPQLTGNIVCFPVHGLGARMGGIADRFFGTPSANMEVVGVTGTNGKTSCTNLLAQALEICDRPSGVIGTLGSGRTGHLSQPGLTTPDVIDVHRILANIRETQGEVVAMEVSSHALDQSRVDGVRFKVAAFTNLSRDHLDYHGTMEDYAQAKRRLFETPGLEYAVINGDDPVGASLLEEPPPGVVTVCVSRGAQVRGDHHVTITATHCESAGLSIEFDTSWGKGRLDSHLWGEFNADNLALTLAVLLTLGVSFKEALSALSGIHAPAGRLEVFKAAVEGSELASVVVDYAHTPDALAKALQALRTHTSGKIWCVFGCGGERDSGKRPQMGAVAESLADVVIVTDDNPRGEDPADIRRQVLEGAPQAREIGGRREAILAAIAEAGAEDIVLVAGKGHETGQIIGSGDNMRVLPFDDVDVARECVAEVAR
ncbi:MAG: UDP-N-acetylmuramoyl-L-alanyl-D-glutamate--2,6-diaminopimelate ligase, partial [Gammaproteobacteria bacterium]